uniref:Uncharacterized protein n=1 Tax=Anguilla anguilla TaxID=7936 RepID=A0A0E9VXU3_ANGAN
MMWINLVILCELLGTCFFLRVLW